MYYPSSENKGADQLRGYREADLRLCFRLCRLLVFPWGGSFILVHFPQSHDVDIQKKYLKMILFEPSIMVLWRNERVMASNTIKKHFTFDYYS